jgi:hypothetical protein
MSDNLRQYRAIRDAILQGYPGQPQGQRARHLVTLAALISGIVASKSAQLPKIASQVPNGTSNRSGSANLPLAIPSVYDIPCRHGNTAFLPARGVGTDASRSASLYSGTRSACRDLDIHGPRLPGAGPHVTGTGAPNLPEFLTPPFERSATARTATSPSESATSWRTTGSPGPYAHPDPYGRRR